MTERGTPGLHVDAARRAIDTVAAAHALGNQPHALFDALDTAFADAIGHTLFTILAYDGASRESNRVYSNSPAAYPTGVRKALAGGRWTEIVLTRGDPYIGRTADDLRSVFPDHELIASLGCESVLNVPVRWRGATLASLNLLHTKDWYRDTHVPLARALAQLALPGLLPATHLD